MIATNYFMMRVMFKPETTMCLCFHKIFSFGNDQAGTINYIVIKFNN